MKDIKTLCNANLRCIFNENAEKSEKELCKLDFFSFTKDYQNQQLSKQANS
jgi:hypothetical protein